MLTSRRLGRDSQLQKASENSPPLRKGSSGSGVKELQDVLYDLRFGLQKSFSKGKPDGIFGPETEQAVRSFQQQNSLTPDGVAGRQTLTLLDRIVAADPTLEIPDPAERARQELSDRGKPIYHRFKAHW